MSSQRESSEMENSLRILSQYLKQCGFMHSFQEENIIITNHRNKNQCRAIFSISIFIFELFNLIRFIAYLFMDQLDAYEMLKVGDILRSIFPHNSIYLFAVIAISLPTANWLFFNTCSSFDIENMPVFQFLQGKMSIEEIGIDKRRAVKLENKFKVCMKWSQICMKIIDIILFLGFAIEQYFQMNAHYY